MRMSPDHAVLAIGCADGSLQLWEAVSAAVLNMLSRPMSAASPLNLATAASLAEAADLEIGPWFSWCETVLRERFLTAIGIAEPRVAAGAFDIHLDA